MVQFKRIELIGERSSGRTTEMVLQIVHDITHGVCTKALILAPLRYDAMTHVRFVRSYLPPYLRYRIDGAGMVENILPKVAGSSERINIYVDHSVFDAVAKDFLERSQLGFVSKDPAVVNTFMY